MTHQEEWDSFLATSDTYDNITDLKMEMERLYKENSIATVELPNIAEAIVSQFNDGHRGIYVRQFAATPQTHGLSTADEFHVAKSELYLHNAETRYAQDDVARDAADGWSQSDSDIGDAE